MIMMMGIPDIDEDDDIDDDNDDNGIDNSIQFKFYFTSLKKASTNYMDYNLRKQKQNRLHT